MPENENLEVSKSAFNLSEHREAEDYAQHGMYEYINEENFISLSPEALTYYQISAIGTLIERLKNIRGVVVNDPDSYSRIVWQIRNLEMKAQEIVCSIYPESGVESSPVLLGGADVTTEIDWYIDHGIPEALNVLNIPALESFGNENIEVLRIQAEKRRKALGIDSSKNEHIGFGPNGTSNVE